MAEADTHAKKVEVMRDQCRARNAVYINEKGSIPAIGKGTGVEESERLEKEVRALVEKELPGKKGCPLPLTLRTAHDAPTAEALKQDRQHVQAIVHATQEFLLLVRNGVMRMRRPESTQKKKTTTTKRKRKSKGGGVKSGKKGSKRKRTVPNAAEKALVNVEFEEEGTEWCVLMVKFDDDADELVVYYYDVDSQFSREELECDLMHDDVERSSVKEVVKWIKDSSK